MSTVMYDCGCFISRSMYGEHEIVDVGCCQKHLLLFSQAQTLEQMAEKIRNAATPPPLGVHVAEIVEHQEKLS